MGIMACVELAKSHRDEADINGEYGDWECRGRDDVAVDVMTIVGSVLWGGPTFLVSG
jgi:hypothetical protein